MSEIVTSWRGIISGNIIGEAAEMASRKSRLGGGICLAQLQYCRAIDGAAAVIIVALTSSGGIVRRGAAVTAE